MEKNDSNSDLIICLIIGFMFLSELIWTFSIDFVDNFYTSIWYIPFTIISGLLSALIPIILAFVVSNKSKFFFLFSYWTYFFSNESI